MASSSLGVGLLSKHQVFINFRGDGLRTGFISFLIDALKENGVKYFVDELENRGEDLNNLFKRIEESSIALVIFSKKYSESRWCLDELVKIEEQVEKGQLVAIPIFYNVEASDVKELKKEFGKNFMILAWRWKRESKKWEKALLSISGKMGLTLNKNGNERSSIGSIIEEVKKVLTKISSKEIETEELGIPPQMAKYDKIGEPIAFKEDHKKKEIELHPSKNIVLVGETGNGKSATGNSILGQKAFDSKRRGSGDTMECKSVKCVTPEGTSLNVIDTPGLFDMSAYSSHMADDSTNPPRHQVFISFRGQELRKTFIGFLVKALRVGKVNFFIDESEMRSRDLQHLFKRIEESSVSVVIFSERYTESKWCLDELVKIKEQMDKGTLEVIPIFYELDATDVKRCKGKFGDNYRDLKWRYQNEKDRTQKWKAALKSVPEKFGLKSIDYRNDSELVDSIVEEVKKVLIDISLVEIYILVVVLQLLRPRKKKRKSPLMYKL